MIWLLQIVGALTTPTSMAFTYRWRSRPQACDRTRKHRDRGAGDEQIGAQGNGKRLQADLRQIQPPRSKGFRRNRVVPSTRRRKNPTLIDQFGKINLPSSGPSVLRSSGHDQLIVEKNFHVQTVDHAVVCKRRPTPRHHEIKSAVNQVLDHRIGGPSIHIRNHAGILLGDLLDDRRKYR